VSWSGALIIGAWRGLKLGMIPILAAYGIVLAGAILVSAIAVAPRVFVFTPTGLRRRRVKSIKEIPAAAAYWVAIATRLHGGSGWAEAGGLEGFAQPVDATWPDRLTGTSALDWRRIYGVPPIRPLCSEDPGREDQSRHSTFRG
jgi:hypothetical protein